MSEPKEENKLLDWNIDHKHGSHFFTSKCECGEVLDIEQLIVEDRIAVCRRMIKFMEAEVPDYLQTNQAIKAAKEFLKTL